MPSPSQLRLQAIKDEAGSSTPPPGYKQDSTVSYDRSQGQLSPVEESPPDDMPAAWLFPGGLSGHDHVVLTGPQGQRGSGSWRGSMGLTCWSPCAHPMPWRRSSGQRRYSPLSQTQ
ncbi:receptor-type tyrosine-protein phosphatase V-like isoform X2 [Lemur catta]|uniref:receptor-type tyrosine-protein phosphatase V-like isoform X2 n=1 Tax=Lemur catta TaxID=9447 RepID=UPI001E2668D0|nr:receptor-type tyrosine-protein phosphatase V-like isoform X2 [Lemur catta]